MKDQTFNAVVAFFLGCFLSLGIFQLRQLHLIRQEVESIADHLPQPGVTYTPLPSGTKPEGDQ